jgi:hypothetical protein
MHKWRCRQDTMSDYCAGVQWRPCGLPLDAPVPIPRADVMSGCLLNAAARNRESLREGASLIRLKNPQWVCSGHPNQAEYILPHPPPRW